MAKISELSDGGSLQSTDYLIAVRSGGNVKVQADGNLSLGTITTTGSVGIGTTSPDNLLHLHGTPIIRLTTATTGETATDGLIFGSNADGSSFLWTYENEHLYFGTNNTERVRITEAGLVGIGTASPAYPLEIKVGSDKVLRAGTSFVSIDSTGSASAPSLIIDGDDNTGFWHPAADTLAVSTNGTERMRINSSGNVGIATTEPPEGFAIGATSSVAGFSIGSGDTQVFLRYNNYFSGTAQVSDATKGTASISLGRGSDGVITFNTEAAAAGVPAERMRIDSSGRVGIGTTSPVAPLTIGGTNQISFIDSAQGGINTNDAGATASITGYALRYRQNVGSGFHAWDVSGNTTAGGALTYSEVMRITSTGSVGIGSTSTGGYKLDVAGTARANSLSFRVDGSAPAGDAAIFRPAAGSIALATNSSERMRIDSSGLVGIGSITMSSYNTNFNDLVVDGGTNSGVTVVSGTTGDGTIAFADGTTGNEQYRGYIQYTHAGDDLKFGAAGVEAMRIDSSGNVGIGVTPSAWTSAWTALDIGDGTLYSQNNRTTGLGSNIYFTGSAWFPKETGEAALYQISQGTHNWYINSSVTSGVSFTPSAKMTLDASGNLLVGTTSQLSSGGFGSHEIRASNGGGGAAVLVVYNSDATDGATALNAIKNSATTTSSQRFIQFYANAGSTPMGGIVGNGASNVQFATLSDAREKTNIQSISGSLSKINALNPVEFDWISSGEHVNAGFVAQEVEQVFPEFVVENMAGEGEEERKGLTGGMTGGIVAHLVKAIQEQQDLIESLTARIAALEGVN